MVRAALHGHEAVEDQNAKLTPEHVLWMCERVSCMNEFSLLAAFKAARWIGWILCGLEQQHIYNWNNDVSRHYIRQDVKAGYDTPRWCRWLTLLLRQNTT